MLLHIISQSMEAISIRVLRDIPTTFYYPYYFLLKFAVTGFVPDTIR